jgi:hypothetical protein
MKYQITIAIAIALLIVQNGFSQDYYLKGKVVDYETNSKIPGVTILPDSMKNGALTDKHGHFKIRGNTNNLEISFIGYHSLKFVNIPKLQKDIDFGEIKLVEDHSMDNWVICGPPVHSDDEKLIEQDKALKKEVLENYRLNVLGQKLKPYFEGKYLIFDFDKNVEE